MIQGNFVTVLFTQKGKKRYTKKLPETLLIPTKKVQIVRQSHVLSENNLENFSGQYCSCICLFIPSEHLEHKCSFALTSSLIKTDDNGKVFVSAKNLSDNQMTINFKWKYTFYRKRNLVISMTLRNI